MTGRIDIKRLIALLMLLMLFAAPIAVLAQDDGEGGDETTTEETTAEGETAEDGEGTAEGEEGEEEEPSVSPLAPLGINQGFLIAQIFNFILVFGLLTVFLWRPLANMLDSRSEEIAKGLEDAAAAANARRNAEAEADKILSQARSEAAQIVEEARGRGDEVASGIEAQAREEADKIRAEARTGAEAERNAQLAGLRDQVAAISIAVANRLIGEAMTEDRQKQLVDEFFTRVPEGSAQFSGSVEVISAMPLSEAEQNRVSNEIGADEVQFRVDPTILGGLVIRSGERVVDGSVRSSLNDLSSRLN